MSNLFSSLQPERSIRQLLGVCVPMTVALFSYDAQPCTLDIVHPIIGAQVAQQESVDGLAKDLPPSNFLWIFARPRGVSGWFPQGSGPAIVESDSVWTVFATFGILQNSGLKFEIMAAVFDDAGSAAIQQWASNADATGIYRPMQVPRPEPSCQPKIITVMRR